MKTPARKMLLSLLALALFVAPQATVRAQNRLQPAVVVSIASIDEQFADASYLVQAIGMPELGVFLLGKDELAKGFDTTKPMGGYISLGQGQPEVVAFLSVTDFDGVLERLAGQIGEPQDAGDGLKKIIGPKGKEVYLKPQGSWVFASNHAANLANLPQDPAQLLGGLDKQYNLAVRVNVQNIPKPRRDKAVQWMNQQFDKSLEKQLQGKDPAEREMREKLARNAIKSMVELVEQTDQFTLGWRIDSEAKSTYIDIATTAVEGSKMAERMATLTDMTSQFTGFLLPDAAATLHFASKMTQEDIENTVTMLTVMRGKAMEEIGSDEDLSDQERAAAKDVLGRMLDLLQQTVESGKLDGGAAVLLAPHALTFAAGGYVADGNAVEELLKKVADLAKNEPDFPGIHFGADQHGGVRLHTMKIPVPDKEKEARQLLGDQLDVVIGIGEKSVYLAFGKDAMATLKRVIDKSAADAQKVMPPTQLNIALTPIVKFAASVSDDQNVAKMADALDQVNGKDKIAISSRSIQRGQLTRFEFEEGALQVIGLGVKAVQQMFAGGTGGGPKIGEPGRF